MGLEGLCAWCECPEADPGLEKEGGMLSKIGKFIVFMTYTVLIKGVKNQKGVPAASAPLDPPWRFMHFYLLFSCCS